MPLDIDKLQQLTEQFDQLMPGISLDCVVFGYKDQQLHVLLLKLMHAEAWALPGGFLGREETMEAAVGRVLKERTGLDQIFLTQFYTFSGLDRNWQANAANQRIFEQVFSELPPPLKDKLSAWLNQRFLSSGFLALVNAAAIEPAVDGFSDLCQWVPVSQLPLLVLDHQHIIETALSHLKAQINYLPIGRSLLPERFTMADLQRLYETILQKRLDRANFQRKVLKLNMLNRHEKHMTGAANKAPYLYSFNIEAYQRLVQEGIGFSF